MREQKNAIFSLLCATALALHSPGPAGADQPCPQGSGANGPAHSRQSDSARHCRAGVVEHRLADDPQYRLADDPQYRLASDARDRLVDDPQYRMTHHTRQPVAGGARHHSSLPGKQAIPPVMAARASRYRAVVRATAQAEGIEPELIHAVITAESGYNPSALSHKGAVGLMQLMPDTAAQYGVTNPRDPAQNLNAGARHLRYLLDKFDNDMTLALAAYNAGEQAVSQHGNRIPPYPEIRAYVQRVLAYYHQHLLSSLLPRSL